MPVTTPAIVPCFLVLSKRHGTLCGIHGAQCSRNMPLGQVLDQVNAEAGIHTQDGYEIGGGH